MVSEVVAAVTGAVSTSAAITMSRIAHTFFISFTVHLILGEFLKPTRDKEKFRWKVLKWLLFTKRKFQYY
jgi:hypothetical protein